MQVTRQADYAVRAVLYLAQQEPHERISTAQVSRAQAIPLTFLAKIVSQLAAAGIVQATRGAQGGLRLARPAETVSLLEVVELIDGPLVVNACVLNPETCTLASTCPVRTVWCEAQAQLAQRLAGANFGQLARSAPTATPVRALAL